MKYFCTRFRFVIDFTAYFSTQGELFECRLCNMNNYVLDVTFFEAWYHVEGYVNSQNMRIWSVENSYVYTELSKRKFPRKFDGYMKK
ncbi:hypothetical protein BDFB_014100 [Asbolus verrucosus]|uniref:Uncharacterized protein n=1 Tax=Asbolus verrucosus TaxID=1661398 RepID=A0A482VCR4_ASBVE|nr:hypothetical protein BDFB_014100 [Asbolus verrucosus]